MRDSDLFERLNLALSESAQKAVQEALGNSPWVNKVSTIRLAAESAYMAYVEFYDNATEVERMVANMICPSKCRGDAYVVGTQLFVRILPKESL